MGLEVGGWMLELETWNLELGTYSKKSILAQKTVLGGVEIIVK